jgi:hypothetical protein
MRKYSTRDSEESLHLEVIVKTSRGTTKDYQNMRDVLDILLREPVDCFPVNPWQEGWMPIFYI